MAKSKSSPVSTATLGFEAKLWHAADLMRIYDPCHGSGGMFSQSMKFIETHSGNRGDVSVFGQEANPDTWKMSKINMAIRGIGADFGMGHKDTLMHDIHAGTQMDLIFANPPFKQKKWGADRVKDDPRWKYGLPGKTLFINATSLGHMEDGTHRVFSDENIAKITTTFEKFRNEKFRKEEGFAAVATTEEIAEKKYKLTPGLYAGGKAEEDDSEPFDAKMKRLTGELGELFGESAQLEKQIRAKAIGYGI